MSNELDSGDEDYMSADFLQKCGDSRPGLVPKKVLDKQNRDVRHQKKNAKNYTKPRKQLEQERRTEGLQSAIGTSNKGFAMLQKMGYKPGMALGKEGTGRKEPVQVALKLGRGGLGREQDLKRKNDAKIARIAERKQKQAKTEVIRREDFLNRMSNRFTQTAAERDLYKSQKVCMQLDEQKGLTEPAEKFFWPPQAMKKEEEEEDASLESGYHRELPDDVEDEEEEEEEKEDVDQEPEVEFEPSEKLEVLTMYLRNRHLYCVWCGTRYEDKDDIAKNCPGDTADAHD